MAVDTRTRWKTINMRASIALPPVAPPRLQSRGWPQAPWCAPASESNQRGAQVRAGHRQGTTMSRLLALASSFVASSSLAFAQQPAAPAPAKPAAAPAAAAPSDDKAKGEMEY